MDNNKIVARVQDNVITEGDLDKALRTLPKQSAQQFMGPQGRKNLLTEMVNQEILYLDAMEKGLDKTEAFEMELKEIAKNLLKQHAVKAVLSNVEVSDEEVKDYYNENPDQFVAQERVRASHILVKEEEDAKNLAKEIANGLSFEEAAGQHSECPSKSQGGDLGYFERGQMVPEFEEIAFNTAVSTISDIVKTQFGYHIIKVVDKVEGSKMEFEQVKDQIKNFLLTEKQNLAYYNHVNELKSKYSVELV